jgi:hypothetical protein
VNTPRYTYTPKYLTAQEVPSTDITPFVEEGASTSYQDPYSNGSLLPEEKRLESYLGKRRNRDLSPEVSQGQDFSRSSKKRTIDASGSSAIAPIQFDLYFQGKGASAPSQSIAASSQDVVTSETAKAILRTLGRLSTPLLDAKKTKAS